MINDQPKIAVVGNPNCGKSTLFNVLTGAKQRIGNWPGVTVERKSAFLTVNATQFELIDLPGIYALNETHVNQAIDEKVANDFIMGGKADLFINVVDVTHLERSLYLTLQLLELGLPVVVALNMMDVAKAQSLTINSRKLAARLGCPVIEISAKKQSGLTALKQIFGKKISSTPLSISYPEVVIAATKTHAKHAAISEHAALFAIEQSAQLLGEEPADVLIADARYQWIQEVVKACASGEITKPWTDRIDRVVLNRYLALPIFLAVMYGLFLFAINIGGAFQDFFDISTQTIFVDGFAYLLTQLQAPSWLIAILANGFGKGINTTVTFIPVIGAMFLFLAFLEDVGYMARAAFIVDRFMRFLGLPGKAFIPMIVGFGCNVPAIMGARTLENPGDRILTIMMSPFMSCGARLAIFAVFTTAFFKTNGQNIIFALYLIGIGMAMFTGFILRRTVLQGGTSLLIMELPPYHWPHWHSLGLLAWQRLSGFVLRAGKLILPICILIGALNALNWDGSLGDGDTQSLLAYAGQALTPIFGPMGIHADNWPATVGLFTGVLAKEVVIGTLNTLYSELGHFALAAPAAFDFWGGLHAAWDSIFTNFAALKAALVNPILAKAPISAMNQGVYGLMAARFDGRVGAFAYLLFVLLYFPCVSTLAVMLKELHRGWAFFSAAWMTGVAYGAAVFFYQAATVTAHPLLSCAWMGGIAVTFLATLFTMRFVANHMNVNRNEVLVT